MNPFVRDLEMDDAQEFRVAAYFVDLLDPADYNEKFPNPTYPQIKDVAQESLDTVLYEMDQHDPDDLKEFRTGFSSAAYYNQNVWPIEYLNYIDLSKR